MKKIILITYILLISILVLAGCTDEKKEGDSTIDPVDTTEPVETSDDDYYDGAVGEILEFDGDTVHILFGDIVDVFKVKPEVAINFYIGESVKLTKEGEFFSLEAFTDGDFSVKHTNTGDLIEDITGTIKDNVDGKKFTLIADKEYEFEYYEDLYLEKGTNVTVEYIQYAPNSEEKQLIAVYNNDSTLELIVNSIERTKDGNMILNAKENHDSESIDYVVYVLGSTSVEFNHSEVEKGSLIMVYPETIRESYPAQVDAQRILLGIID